ncbi:gluconeogenesis factor YvcK family protein [Lutispora thermophila]|uniref:Putative gluconeogenesis factor n=1 Tax=Lutispora thermophila DSM 19022 TaxID=1122184 RepID=A0A1M6I8W3_9FIRM|nr:YvcK family protein [Lutispora thermophila]SHJ30939.1 conserved hypothetical protein, cofD-related [Lutispora thermophila DSM 19022]
MEVNGSKKLVKNNGWAIGGPKVVAIGGGTGLSTLLRGLKAYTSNITAIVTMADDGGGSGILRNDLGMLPPGDIRNCILALANTEPIMERLMEYRFKEGSLKGQSFGNLFIAALNDICGSFDNAVKEISNVLAVTGKVMPVTLDNVTLYAELDDGTIIKGESQIPKIQISSRKRIKRVFLEPEDCKPMEEALEAIIEADAVIIGPGSLYTSIIPNFMVTDVAKTVYESKAMKIYVCNIMTQKGETIGYRLCDHIDAINEHAKHDIIEYAIVNTGSIPEELAIKYMDEYANAVEIDWENVRAKGIKTVEGDFVRVDKGYVRHDYNELSRCIFTLLSQER